MEVVVSIAGGDSWVGIRNIGQQVEYLLTSFNRRWRFLGGDTDGKYAVPTGFVRVSIAGGDSWVGIPHPRAIAIPAKYSFNRRWRFLGGDTNPSERLDSL